MKGAAIIAASPEHFIRNCPLMKTARGQETVKWKGGDGDGKGSPDPLQKQRML